MPYIGKKPADIIATVIDTTTGTFSGEVDAGSLDVSGNADIDGITNLDNTDIDGTLDVSGNLTVDTNTLFVDSANNRVGVGTVSPSGKFQVDGGRSYFSANSDAFALYLRYNTSTAGVFVGSPSTDTFTVSRSGGQEHLRIDSSGNVGIGTSSPQRPLHIAGTTNAFVRIQDTDNNADTDGLIGGLEIRGADGVNAGIFQFSSNVNRDIDIGNETSTGALDFRTNSTQRMRIDSSGNVGIGTDSPSEKLHLVGDMVITPRDQGIKFNNEFVSVFRDIDSLKLSAYSGITFFETNASTERMRIDSSGNLLVGTTSTDDSTDGFKLKSNGQKLTVTRNGAESLVLNRRTSDGDILKFRKDNTAVANIGVSGSNNPYFSSSVANHGGLIFSDGGASTPQMNPISSGSTLVDNAMNIGSASYRFKDLYLSGGVYLGGTGSANKLDDYEEGTFTPTLEDTGGSLNANLTSQIGQYTKIGNLCHIQIRINGDSRSATNNQVYVGGLPFTPSLSNTSNRAEFEVNGINLNLDAGFYSIVGQILHGDTEFNLLMQGTFLDNFRGHDLGSTYEIYVHGAYFTA